MQVYIENAAPVGECRKRFRLIHVNHARLRFDEGYIFRFLHIDYVLGTAHSARYYAMTCATSIAIS